MEAARGFRSTARPRGSHVHTTKGAELGLIERPCAHRAASRTSQLADLRGWLLRIDCAGRRCAMCVLLDFHFELCLQVGRRLLEFRDPAAKGAAEFGQFAWT